jgi:hypothetical protein
VLQKEIKEKKKEMNSLTFQAEDTMRDAKAEKAKAEKAMELADRTSEEIIKKESDLAVRLKQLEESQARLEGDRQSLKHDLMALQEQKKDLEDREADIKLNIENSKIERRGLEEAQLSTEQASDELELQVSGNSRLTFLFIWLLLFFDDPAKKSHPHQCNIHPNYSQPTTAQGNPCSAGSSVVDADQAGGARGRSC